MERLRSARFVACFLLAACATTAPAPRPSPSPASPSGPTPAPAPQLGLYTIDEALTDALSGTLEYIGTGPWPGISRSFSCAFRNERVVVVNAYCSIKEAPAFRIDIYSPGRGRVRIYAEANGPISRRDRAQYFSFVAASEPPPGPEVPLGPVALTMGFDELHGYEKKRYDAYLPTCFAGEENRQPTAGCLGTLSAQAAPWAAQNRDFLAHPSTDYYRLLRLMRDLATRHGKDPR